MKSSLHSYVEHPGLNLDELALPEEQAQQLGRDARIERVNQLIKESNRILEYGIEHYITGEGKALAGICILYSGGNDSTTLAHIFKDRADYAVHANTTIGIEKTRQFVRDTCRAWGLELLEFTPPPGSTYRELVLEAGFPGPGHHFKMYQRLKERCLRQARKQLVTQPRESGSCSLRADVEPSQLAERMFQS